MTKNARIAIRVSEETKTNLEILADYNKRKLSDFLRLEIEEICNKNEELIEKIKKMSNNV